MNSPLNFAGGGGRGGFYNGYRAWSSSGIEVNMFPGGDPYGGNGGFMQYYGQYCSSSTAGSHGGGGGGGVGDESNGYFCGKSGGTGMMRLYLHY